MVNHHFFITILGNQYDIFSNHRTGKSKNSTLLRTAWTVKSFWSKRKKYEANIKSGQISIIPKLELRTCWGYISFTKGPIGVTTWREKVAIICPGQMMTRQILGPLPKVELLASYI